MTKCVASMTKNEANIFKLYFLNYKVLTQLLITTHIYKMALKLEKNDTLVWKTLRQ